MRLEEIPGLRWTIVALMNAEVRLDPGTTKNDDPRTVPLAGELLEMLRIEHERTQGAGFLFTRKGKPVGSFDKAWKAACVRAGLGQMLCRACGTGATRGGQCEECRKAKRAKQLEYRGLIFHDLRRSGVRNLVRAGVPERVAMAISGHKTRAVFERYNIVSGRDIAEAARKLEKYIASRARRSQNNQRPAKVTNDRRATANA